MLLKPGLHRWFVGVAFCVALCGCLPSSQGPVEEQKEMHFLTGKARAIQLDYPGAIEAFEKALEANPRNGSAHFELGLLCEKQGDFSAAIYHFERFLKLRPDSDHTQIVKERINADKMELSRTAAFAPVTQSLNREFDKLAEENKQLRAEVEKWRAYFAAQSATRPQPSVVTAAGRSEVVMGTVANPANSSPSRPAGRTHTVKTGDTPAAIARKYGVKLDALLTANPGLEPKRMKVGQVISVPLP